MTFVCLLIAAKRPPVEETASFLQSLIASHGPNYLEKLFGSKARDALSPLGGVEKVAIALSESQTIEDFGAALHLMRWVPALLTTQSELQRRSASTERKQGCIRLTNKNVIFMN